MRRARVWELICPGLPEEVTRARRLTRDILTGTPRVDDAALIVTELGVNAITHTDSGKHGFRLTITHTPAGTVALSVTDRGGTAAIPHIKHPDDGTSHGRGLGIVTALATRVRIHRDDNGHTVTVELHPTR